MDVDERLRPGMNIPETWKAFSGWRFQYVDQPNSSPRCHTWDCVDPFDDETVIRVTFIDGLLLIWGAPAADPPVYRVRVNVFPAWRSRVVGRLSVSHRASVSGADALCAPRGR